MLNWIASSLKQQLMSVCRCGHLDNNCCIPVNKNKQSVNEDMWIRIKIGTK
jgi:hypothetical protein